MFFRTLALSIMLPAIVGSVTLSAPSFVYAQEAEPRIFHTIKITPRDDADPKKLEEVMDKVRELGSTRDFVQDFIVGADLSGEYKFSVTYILDGYEGYRAYLFDPLHLEIDGLALPMAKDMRLIDVVDTDNPTEVAARLEAIQIERFEQIEGLAEMFQQIGR